MLLSRIDLLKKAVSGIAQHSPLIIQGDAGLGKSFFAHELCDCLLQKGIVKNCKTVYSWDVLNSMIEALSMDKIDAWRKDLLSSDLILIEEFHFLNDKPTVLKELYQLFRVTNMPIIITTDLPIRNENVNCTEIVAFFEQGTLVLLPPPTLEESKSYLEHMLRERAVHLSEDSLEWLMNQKITKLTLARGIVKTLHLYSLEGQTTIELEHCKAIVRPLLVEVGLESV